MSPPDKAQAEADEELPEWPVALYVPTVAALARVLGITPPAVRKAEAWGKIEHEDDGSWDVLAAVEGWRFSTWSALQRPSRTRLAVLDPSRDFTDEDMGDLIVRTRAEGGEVFEYRDQKGWVLVPPLAAVLRAGTPLGEASALELDAVVSCGVWWHLRPSEWAAAVAAHLAPG